MLRKSVPPSVSGTSAASVATATRTATWTFERRTSQSAIATSTTNGEYGSAARTKAPPSWTLWLASTGSRQPPRVHGPYESGL